MRPVIAIPTQSFPPSGPQGVATWAMNQSYVRAVAAAGGMPILLPLMDGENYLQGESSLYWDAFEYIHGILLPGGVDVCPTRYGAVRAPYCDAAHPDRDQVELELAAYALATGTPVLGICRGAQVLNVSMGGTLYQDLALERPGPFRHDCWPAEGVSYQRTSLVHEVVLQGQLAGIMGAERLMVNSLHHQGVRDLGLGWAVAAHAPDHLIEAFCHAEHPFAVGVQWHPEELIGTDAPTRALFDAFVKACISESGLDRR